MAKKHQIWSKKKSTRQRAGRKWRRCDKQSLLMETKPLFAPKTTASKPVVVPKAKTFWRMWKMMPKKANTLVDLMVEATTGGEWEFVGEFQNHNELMATEFNLKMEGYAVKIVKFTA